MNRVVPNIVTDGCKDHIAWIEKALDGKVKVTLSHCPVAELDLRQPLLFHRTSML